MTWDCAGCNIKLEIMDIAVLGPGTLKWCKDCIEKLSILAKKLNIMFEEGTLTVKVILQMTEDRICSESATK